MKVSMELNVSDKEFYDLMMKSLGLTDTLVTC